MSTQLPATGRAPLLRSAAFRLGALQATLFALIALVLFGVTWWAVRGYVENHLRQAVLDEVGEVASAPPPQLPAEIQRLVHRAPDGPFFYALIDADGRQAGGDLIAPHARVGWFDLERKRADADGDEISTDPIMAYGRRIADGRLVVVGRDRRSEDRLEDLLQDAFIGAGAAAVLLALLGGLMAARSYLRRVQSVADSAERIVAGDLTARIADSGRDDEFDRLAAVLNGMLARIEQLMEGVRQVSNDIAHDLRTPLTHLRQHLEMAGREADSVDAYRAAVERAIDDVDGVLATFAALLRIAQIESRQRRAGFADVDLSALVTSVAGDYLPVFQDQQRRFSVEVAPGQRCRGDRALLTQMLANLLENALHHTPEGSDVSLGLSPGERGPVLIVRDHGPGIPAAERTRVFQRFARLDRSRSTPGAGLGMALVAAVADSHGLTVKLADAEPGLMVIVDFPGTRT